MELRGDVELARWADSLGEYLLVIGRAAYRLDNDDISDLAYAAIEIGERLIVNGAKTDDPSN